MNHLTHAEDPYPSPTITTGPSPTITVAPHGPPSAQPTRPQPSPSTSAGAGTGGDNGNGGNGTLPTTGPDAALLLVAGLVVAVAGAALTRAGQVRRRARHTA